MTASRPTFRPITAPLEADDDALERLNEKMGVPALRRPPAETPLTDQQTAQDSPKAEARPSPAGLVQDPPKARKPAIATPGPVERFTLDLPGYLTDAIRRHAAEHRTTARHLVIRGLAALGFEIAPDDLVPDARRRQGKSRKP